jgi:hypothetical protein
MGLDPYSGMQPVNPLVQQFNQKYGGAGAGGIQIINPYGTATSEIPDDVLASQMLMQSLTSGQPFFDEKGNTIADFSRFPSSLRRKIWNQLHGVGLVPGGNVVSGLSGMQRQSALNLANLNLMGTNAGNMTSFPNYTGVNQGFAPGQFNAMMNGFPMYGDAGDSYGIGMLDPYMQNITLNQQQEDGGIDWGNLALMAALTVGGFALAGPAGGMIGNRLGSIPALAGLATKFPQIARLLNMFKSAPAAGAAMGPMQGPINMMGGASANLAGRGLGMASRVGGIARPLGRVGKDMAIGSAPFMALDAIQSRVPAAGSSIPMPAASPGNLPPSPLMLPSRPLTSNMFAQPGINLPPTPTNGMSSPQQQFLMDTINNPNTDPELLRMLMEGMQ